LGVGFGTSDIWRCEGWCKGKPDLPGRFEGIWGGKDEMLEEKREKVALLGVWVGAGLY
jgi:hypothetical protein